KSILACTPTYYALPTMLVCRHPLAFGRDMLGLAPGESTIASVLKESGFQTAAYVAANPYLSARFGYGQGFDVFRDFLDASAVELSPEADAPSRSVLRTGINETLS